VRQLAELVIELTDSKSRIVHRALPKDDPTQRRPDISLAKHTLGWTPSVELREGLIHTIDYFDGVLLAEDKVRRCVQL
jgi:UDP-glucuronate decarboxylase